MKSTAYVRTIDNEGTIEIDENDIIIYAPGCWHYAIGMDVDTFQQNLIKINSLLEWEEEFND